MRKQILLGLSIAMVALLSGCGKSPYEGAYTGTFTPTSGTGVAMSLSLIDTSGTVSGNFTTTSGAGYAGTLSGTSSGDQLTSATLSVTTPCVQSFTGTVTRSDKTLTGTLTSSTAACGFNTMSFQVTRP